MVYFIYPECNWMQFWCFLVPRSQIFSAVHIHSIAKLITRWWQPRQGFCSFNSFHIAVCIALTHCSLHCPHILNQIVRFLYWSLLVAWGKIQKVLFRVYPNTGKCIWSSELPPNPRTNLENGLQWVMLSLPGIFFFFFFNALSSWCNIISW